MSDTAILESIAGLRADVDLIKKDVCFLKKKKIYIEDIAIGSFLGWVKLTVGGIVLIVAFVGSLNFFIWSIDTLRLNYGLHLKYLHNTTQSELLRPQKQ